MRHLFAALILTACSIDKAIDDVVDVVGPKPEQDKTYHIWNPADTLTDTTLQKDLK